MVNLVRASARAVGPMRPNTKRDIRRLGSYPVPPESKNFWRGRFQVPGGQIQQGVSPMQQKIFFQWWWNLPTRDFASRYFWRFTKWSDFLIPSLMWYTGFLMCKNDVEEGTRSRYWY
ncbi:conserved hypothetical protein [Perkinsus marinus ATCC 50983]|uniref:Uncharacterized protein n=1 Tax=Perkinsus marinus (strain ATCC 50983 / TXsc) TaxID=423536 RepID=C5KCH3_PERM5|nr:conserved hypothetical protein [Perkinsus marinus ATCC 50983]EER17835.1 conserved hypothetical protein [Perkinsus marinus ATCC 50983]|eukprot:XP_002786039.1 conserved hypothetical protein [Perkinsus marinus ATCC 50983]